MPYASVNHPNGHLRGHVQVPASKSISNRVLLLQALAGQEPFTISNLSLANDTLVLRKALQEIASGASTINVADAGTAFRFLTAYLSITPGQWELSGTARLHQRPIAPLVEALRSLGASIDYIEQEGYAPLRINGKQLHGNTLSIDASMSSQFVTALLLISPAFANGLTINLVNEVSSASYIHMTLQLLQQAGIQTDWNAQSIRIEPGKPFLKSYTVEADWSSIAFFYEMAALAQSAEIIVEAVTPSLLQGDAQVATHFETYWGIKSTYKNGHLIITKTAGVVYPHELPCLNFNTTPDLAQAWFATAAGNAVNCTLSGIGHLLYKETDRLTALQKELLKLNATLNSNQETDTYALSTKGLPRSLSTLAFETYKDHRMAMALAPLALTKRPVLIAEPTVVHKSFPAYWQQLQQLGFQIQYHT